MEIENIKKDEVILIGDTLHDYEVSKHIGIKCLLYKNGHQNLEKSNDYGIYKSIKLPVTFYSR